jgi:gas vesicle protein
MVNKDDILEALGIETNNNNWYLHALAGFGVGCVVGAAVAIFLAPKSGAELREDLMERGRDLMHKGREQFAQGEKPAY